MSFGNAAGPKKAYQLDMSYPGTPDSESVGRSGQAGVRFAVDTAMARTRPALAAPIVEGTDPNERSTSPVETARMLGPAPLNGMCIMRVSVSDMSSSAARCEGAPLPPEPKLSLPGLAFASAISSRADLTGTEGCVTSNMQVCTRKATG